MNTEINKTKLEEEKAILISELSAIGRIVDENTGTWEVVVPAITEEIDSDPNSNADRFEDYEANTSKLKALTGRLADINTALARMESGKYGTCEVCNNKIEEDRMEANPAANTCKEHMNG